MFDRPTLALLITYATLPNFTAFAVAVWLLNKFDADYFLAYLMAFFVGCETLYAIIMQLAGEFVVWNDNRSTDAPRRPIDSQPLSAQPMKPRTNYGQVTPLVKIDSVRLFNRALIEQRNGNLEVHMDETYWLKKADGADEHRWSKLCGGQGRSDFIDIRERMVHFGAAKIIGGQGKRVPDDWQKIRALERGTPLPHYEQ